MALTNILAGISSLNDRDKEYILDYLTRHFSVSPSQQGALIGELRERESFLVVFIVGIVEVHQLFAMANEMVANVISAKTVIN